MRPTVGAKCIKQIYSVAQLGVFCARYKMVSTLEIGQLHHLFYGHAKGTLYEAPFCENKPTLFSVS